MKKFSALFIALFFVQCLNVVPLLGADGDPVLEGKAATGSISTTGALSGATLNTGQGANELYDMDQNVLTTSEVTFGKVTTDEITAPAASLVIKPTTDAVTAVQVQDKDGNNILNVDTTNNRVGIGTATPNTSLDIQGGQTVKITVVSAATYDLLVTDYILHVTYTSTAAVTSLTLPTAQCVVGRIITIKDAGGSAGTNNITVDTEGAETIDGLATYVIDSNYEAIGIYSDGSNWFVF